MSIVERLTLLQKEKELTDKAVEVGAGLSGSTLYQWKNGRGKPSLENIVKVANFFNVTTDFLLGLSNIRNFRELEKILTVEEEPLLSAYRISDAEGKFRIIQVCMNEKEAAEKRNAVSAG